jgi:hypothetical protein
VPFFRTIGSACALRASGTTLVAARCPAPALLVREELNLSGWSATVDGRPARLRPIDHVVSAVRLPKGASTVTFSYTPPHLAPAETLTALGGAAALAVLFVPFLKRRRRRAAGHG